MCKDWRNMLTAAHSLARIPGIAAIVVFAVLALEGCGAVVSESGSDGAPPDDPVPDASADTRRGMDAHGERAPDDAGGISTPDVPNATPDAGAIDETMPRGYPGEATSPRLPILLISATAPIVDEPKVSGRLRIIEDHDGTFRHDRDDTQLAGRPIVLDMPIGVELRGATSVGLPQKSYSLELRDTSGVGRKVPVLGMPKGEDWALVACWMDKTCMRNTLAHAIGRELGRWNPKTRFVEVFVNGTYQGLYLMIESIRRAAERVAISGPAPNAASGDITGGYIFAREARGKGLPTTVPPRDWLSPVTAPGAPNVAYQNIYTYRSPNDVNITPEQRAYLKDYVARWEEMMKATTWSDPAKGYRAWIDVPSFVDYVLMKELANDPDTYWKSVYFTKESDLLGGKLFLAPLWDYNNTLGGVGTSDGWRWDAWRMDLPLGRSVTSVWFPTPLPPFCSAGFCTMAPTPYYSKRLWSDPAFRNDMKCRWSALRKGPLDLAFIDAKIKLYKDNVAPLAVPRHFLRWPELRKPVTTNLPQPCGIKVAELPEPCGSPTGPVGPFFEYEVKWLRDWIAKRLGWMDANLPGICGA